MRRNRRDFLQTEQTITVPYFCVLLTNPHSRQGSECKQLVHSLLEQTVVAAETKAGTELHTEAVSRASW